MPAVLGGEGFCDIPRIELQPILALLVQASDSERFIAQHPSAVVWTCFVSHWFTCKGLGFSVEVSILKGRICRKCFDQCRDSLGRYPGTWPFWLPELPCKVCFCMKSHYDDGYAQAR